MGAGQADLCRNSRLVVELAINLVAVRCSKGG